MELLKSLVGFVSESPFNSVWTAVVLWSFWPGAMLLAGPIFESRIVPIGKHQSKAFMPGDLTLSIMFVSLLNIHERTYQDKNWWGYSPILYTGVFAIMALVALILRANDVANYPNKRSAMSPTKIMHDVVGYYFIPAVLAALGLPQLIDCIICGDIAQNLTSWLVFGTALFLYTACVIYDAIRPATAEDIKLRHPPNWKPIWR